MKKNYLFYATLPSETAMARGIARSRQVMVYYSGDTDSFHALDAFSLGLDVVCTVSTLLMLLLASLSVLAPAFWSETVAPRCELLFWGGAVYFVLYCVYRFFYCARQLRRAGALKNTEPLPRELVLTRVFLAEEPRKLVSNILVAAILACIAVWGKTAAAPKAIILGWAGCAAVTGACFSGGGFGRLKAIGSWKAEYEAEQQRRQEELQQQKLQEQQAAAEAAREAEAKQAALRAELAQKEKDGESIFDS